MYIMILATGVLGQRDTSDLESLSLGIDATVSEGRVGSSAERSKTSAPGNERCASCMYPTRCLNTTTKCPPSTPLDICTMSDNNWLKSLHSERMNRRGGGNVPSFSSPMTTTSPAASSTDTSDDRKRKAEVIDLLDDDDETEESSRQKKRRQQKESDAALARRLSLQQYNQAPPNNNAAAGLASDYDDGFHKLASKVLFQLISRHDAAASLQRVSAQCGGQMTPRSVVKLGSEGLARILGEEKKAKKANAIIDLARKWSTLPSCPRAFKGPCSAADKHFVTAVTKSPKSGGVAGIGKWTLHTFLEDLGRTDILNADCYEVQQGVRWLTGSEKSSAASVREFCVEQNFRPQSMTQISAIMRNLHRAVQAILGFGPKKRKTPNAEDRVKIGKAIAHTRKELEGL